MKILNIISQKPFDTGSGIYFSELVDNFCKFGNCQELIFAIYEDDVNYITKRFNNKSININYILFNSKDLPIKIAGMSDTMPYDTMKYSDFIKNNSYYNLWEDNFKNKIKDVIYNFKPDIIICHHLYLLTAITIELCKSFKNYSPKIYGICHNTDLRQYQQTDFKRDFIKNNLKYLDNIFFPSIEHANIALKLFNFDKNKCKVVGIGFNSDIFKKNNNYNDKNTLIKILYVGKIAKKKGVLSLIRSINLLNNKNIILDLIGGAGNLEEYNEIYNESRLSNSKINFIDSISQEKLAMEYNKHDIFVLPSFSEGIPMVPIEALACGLKVIVTDLPGVKEFYSNNIQDAYIDYIPLPKLTNVDNATKEELEKFETKLSYAIKKCIEDKETYNPVINNLSWENIAKKIIES